MQYRIKSSIARTSINMLCGYLKFNTRFLKVLEVNVHVQCTVYGNKNENMKGRK